MCSNKMLVSDGRIITLPSTHLAVYQHFSEQEGEWVPAHLEIEGRVTAINDLNMSELHRIGVELTLRLPKLRPIV